MWVTIGHITNMVIADWRPLNSLVFGLSTYRTMVLFRLVAISPPFLFFAMKYQLHRNKRFALSFCLHDMVFLEVLLAMDLRLTIA